MSIIIGAITTLIVLTALGVLFLGGIASTLAGDEAHYIDQSDPSDPSEK